MKKESPGQPGVWGAWHFGADFSDMGLDVIKCREARLPAVWPLVAAGVPSAQGSGIHGPES